MSTSALETVGVDATLAGFARALRAAGLPVTQDRAQAFLAAVAAVGADSRAGVYWAGRATLCSEPDHFGAYDKVFDAWFRGEVPRLTRSRSNAARPAAALVDAPGGSGEGRESDTEVVRARASDADVLRHRDVADLTPAERAVLAQMFATLHPHPPLRRSARRRPSRRGALDVRRTLR